MYNWYCCLHRNFGSCNTPKTVSVKLEYNTSPFRREKFLPLGLVLSFSNTLTIEAFFVMQTADSKSDVLGKEGRTVSGAPALEKEVGFGLGQA